MTRVLIYFLLAALFLVLQVTLFRSEERRVG